MFYSWGMTCTPKNLDFFLQLLPTSATGSLQTLSELKPNSLSAGASEKKTTKPSPFLHGQI